MRKIRQILIIVTAALFMTALPISSLAAETEVSVSAEADSERILGDLSGDGSVDIEDALLLFKHSMMGDLYPIDYPGILDFIKNDQIDIEDAMRLFQYSLMPGLYPIEWGIEAPIPPEDPFGKDNVYNILISFREDYPEGMPWTNDNYYGWNGGIYSGGYGCAGFAFLLSDAVFGNLPARIHYDMTNIRPGDILRINNDTHSVIVLEVNLSSVTVAEGNYNRSIHWGRVLSFSELDTVLTYVMTRYPD